MVQGQNVASEARLRRLVGKVIVTTGDIRDEYEIIRPIFFQVSNKGFFSSKFDTLSKKYAEEMKNLEQNSNTYLGEIGRRFLMGEFSVNEDDFEKAFYIATEELKRKAVMIGADAIVHMRQDIDLDTDGFAYFYLQMYGTAVKLKNESPTEDEGICKICGAELQEGEKFCGQCGNSIM